MRPAAAQHEVEALRQAVHERDQEIAMLRAQVARLDGLEAEIRALRAQLRSEAKDRAKLEARLKELLAKRKRAADALASHPQLFEDPVPEPTLPCVKEAPDGETAQDVIRPRHRRTKEPRKIAYAALPREYVTHELSRNERVCKATGLPLVEVDSKVFEELDYRPAKLVVVVHTRKIYGLDAETAKERQVESHSAPMPPRPIEQSQAGAGLLAHLLVQKFCNHLPFYRQQAIFERDGLFLPRQTLCDWFWRAHTT